MRQNIYSWNVNGLRAIAKKGFSDWIGHESPDILAIQETKAHPEQLSEDILHIPGYTSYFMSAEKKGYSGTALYTKKEPLSIRNMGNIAFDNEGRVLIADFSTFTVINCYFPNSQAEGARLDYKLAFCNAIHETCNELMQEGKQIILCGDYNIAHTEIDLKNPKQNEKNPGYLPEERAWMGQFLSSGYLDTFRHFHPGEPDHYSWWSYRFKARERNIGWRIDYHCINESFKEALIDAAIHTSVMGSDHCPVSISIDV